MIASTSAKSRGLFTEVEKRMVKFIFFVHCNWVGGDYKNTHFARDAKEVEQTVKEWNENGHQVDLLSIEEITDEEFAEDYIGAL